MLAFEIFLLTSFTLLFEVCMRYFSSASLRCVSSAAVLVISAAFSCAHAGFDSNLIKKLDKECSQGDSSACLSLGEFYQTGEEVREDQVKALFYYEKACDLDNSVSCSIAGSYYASGIGVESDRDKAIKLFAKGCSLDDVASCAALGSYYMADNKEVKALDLYPKGLLYESC